MLKTYSALWKSRWDSAKRAEVGEEKETLQRSWPGWISQQFPGQTSGSNPRPNPSLLLFALMGICLWHRLRQSHLELVAPQWHLLVVGDEVVQTIKHQVVSQEELRAAGILAGVNAAMLHLPVAPAEQNKGRAAYSGLPAPASYCRDSSGQVVK